MLAVEEALSAGDMERYFALVQPLCEEGVPEAMCAMGTQYAIGVWVPFDRKKGEELLLRAAEAGEAVAWFHLAQLYRGTPRERECLIKAKQLGFDGSIWEDYARMKDL